MRTYEVLFLSGTRLIYRTVIKAANKYDAKAIARTLPLPTTEQPTSTRIKQIKNKGDR